MSQAGAQALRLQELLVPLVEPHLPLLAQEHLLPKVPKNRSAIRALRVPENRSAIWALRVPAH